MDKLRWLIIGVLLFLVIAVDFTGKLMSMLADGVLVAGVVALAYPMIKRNT
ncbi:MULTISPECIES: DUF3927 family protein [Enterobacter cloacae complex]|jgi:hypothetical protein|uniref:DUF3927 domain-containing protein n=1 Tax=Enterobacter cancerogenus TaxID=69218 RepID=A0A484YDL7_9ENTR|nr:DUF3927 family protein [Enterobacter hormaechei]MCP1112804.1 DUF3927 family protein [Enterobacter bugandensis]VFS33837.1 Uncharacterised protein [Enterobacter cancerogenus]HAV1616511.1 DUF3927 domain-containing protein [Enterobacter hormaechei subsp. xiangfangensis]ELC6491116.1 DUF3927 family protein [Enterobacter hormaechei]MBJ6531570.1 DUF3927 family protein [Enterobacter hormaechei]